MPPPSTDAPHLVTGTFTPANAPPSSSSSSHISPATTADVASPASARSPFSFNSPLHHRQLSSRGRAAVSGIMSAYTPSESRLDGSDQRAPSEDGSSNPLKRRNTEAIDYPRRRATIACEVCRSRKSRCDGTKPKCKLCTELGAECVYREPGVKLDAGDKLILDRLDRIEGLVQSLVGSSSKSALVPSNGSPTTSNDTAIAGGPPPPPPTTSNGDAQPYPLKHHLDPIVSLPNTGLGVWVNRPQPPNISTMPRIHTGSAMRLLSWPRIRDLVSHQYNPQVLLQLEMDREPLHTLAKTPPVVLANTPEYIKAYFDHVNVWYACVNPYTWKSHYRTALTNGFREGPESCIVLLVLALGQASMSGSISRNPHPHDPPGLQYFAAAWSLLPAMMTSHGVLATQCHLLAAAYLFYLVRPLEAWGLLSTTSTKLQLLLMSPSRIPDEQRELTDRIYWNVLLFESDLLVELDLPHSGAVQYEDRISLPGGFNGDPTPDDPGSDNVWYFLAEISLRRLLNRVVQLIYSPGSSISTSSFTTIVSELNYQLRQWYDNLPLALQFAGTRGPIPDPIQTVLRLRYYACKTIIYRPYILDVLENEDAVADPIIQTGCHNCLEAAVRQLEHIEAHHSGHMPYLWQGALSIVSQTLLVMAASLSPPLADILYSIVNPSDLDRIINDVVGEMKRYAHLAPSLALSAEIVQEAEVRRKAYHAG